MNVENLTDESVVTDPMLLDIGEDPLPVDLQAQREVELDDYQAALAQEIAEYLDAHADDEPEPEGLPEEEDKDADKAAGGTLVKAFGRGPLLSVEEYCGLR